MITALHNLQLISGGTITVGKAILIENARILAITNENEMPLGCVKHDVHGAFVAPGFVDLQIYGSGGKLFAGKPEVAALIQMEDDLLKQGTTGFFACIGTNSNDIV